VSGGGLDFMVVRRCLSGESRVLCRLDDRDSAAVMASPSACSGGPSGYLPRTRKRTWPGLWSWRATSTFPC
jgi:hypothetical protein